MTDYDFYLKELKNGIFCWEEEMKLEAKRLAREEKEPSKIVGKLRGFLDQITEARIEGYKSLFNRYISFMINGVSVDYHADLASGLAEKIEGMNMEDALKLIGGAKKIGYKREFDRCLTLIERGVGVENGAEEAKRLYEKDDSLPIEDLEEAVITGNRTILERRKKLEYRAVPAVEEDEPKLQRGADPEELIVELEIEPNADIDRMDS